MNTTHDDAWPTGDDGNREPAHEPAHGYGRSEHPSSRPDLRLILGLGSLTLLYPILNIAAHLLGLKGAAGLPLNSWLWLAIAVTWVLVVWLARAAQPLLTLVLTGVAGGVFTALVVIVVQIFFSGGPGLLTAPIAIVSIIAMNAVGGTVCGLIARGLQALTATMGHRR
ncbi:MAG TPA: hypothetical protein VK065_05590 [Brevibacterium sp.]|nr:hypothetical protein [Brevibacterium sp.]